MSNILDFLTYISTLPPSIESLNYIGAMECESLKHVLALRMAPPTNLHRMDAEYFYACLGMLKVQFYMRVYHPAHSDSPIENNPGSISLSSTPEVMMEREDDYTLWFSENEEQALELNHTESQEMVRSELDKMLPNADVEIEDLFS